MESKISFLESITTNINLLKRIKQKHDEDSRYPNLTGIYADDMKLVLDDYINIKESYLNLLSSTGQDNDKIVELTVLNARLTQEKNILVSEKLELIEILEEIYKIVYNKE